MAELEDDDIVSYESIEPARVGVSPAQVILVEISKADSQKPLSKPGPSAAPKSERVTAICAGAYGEGNCSYMLFVKNVPNKDDRGPGIQGESRRQFVAFSLKAPSKRLDGIFNKFKTGLPYSFNYRPSEDGPVGTPLPIITPIQDIMPHRHTGPAGVAPSVRGSLGVPSGKFIYFQILDVPAVKFFKPCMIQLFKDQIPENYLQFSFGGTFLLETRTVPLKTAATSRALVASILLSTKAMSPTSLFATSPPLSLSMACANPSSSAFP